MQKEEGGEQEQGEQEKEEEGSSGPDGGELTLRGHGPWHQDPH